MGEAEEEVAVACEAEDADGHVCAGAGGGASLHAGKQEEQRGLPSHQDQFPMTFLAGPKIGNLVLYARDLPDQGGRQTDVWVE